MGFGWDDVVGGIATGGLYNLGKAAAGGYGGGGGGSVTYGTPVDYSAVMVYMSENNKTVALQQIQSQQFQMEQASLDRQMQLAANLELGLERLDTKLQIGKLEYVQNMTAEENRHVEKMAKAKKDLGNLQNTYSLGADLPPPPAEEDK